MMDCQTDVEAIVLVLEIVESLRKFNKTWSTGSTEEILDMDSLNEVKRSNMVDESMVLMFELSEVIYELEILLSDLKS